MPNKFNANGKIAMIYGLDDSKNHWLVNQLQPLIDNSPDTVDGLSIEPRGVNDDCHLVVEIHGCLTPGQLRILADAIENTPNK